MRLRNLLRLRRWALVAQVEARQFRIWSWHLTYNGARRRRDIHHRTHAARGTVLWVYAWHRLADLPGEVVR